jgi:protein-tyrosine phosphatase
MNLLELFKPRKKITTPIDFSQIAVDMHSHLIPGIDDGSKSMNDTLVMLEKFEKLGYKKIITTPHIYSDYYKNTQEIILKGLKDVQKAARNHGLSIEIEAAAEYYCDEHFLELIERKELLTIGGKYVLMEFPFLSEMTNWKQFVFAVSSTGYTPIIAHFERYFYWHKDQSIIQEMKELGAKIQLNINSLTGHYGSEVKQQAELLIRKELVDFVSSDCHRIQHLSLMENKAALSSCLHTVVSSGKLLNTSLL